MAESALHEAAEELMRAAIHSFDSLELLLLLQRTAPRSWTLDQLAVTLRSPSEGLAQAVEVLTAHGLVAVVPGQPLRFSYQPRDAALASAVHQLVSACETNRMGVVMTISSNAIHRVRCGALRAFSDALRRLPERHEPPRADERGTDDE